MYRLFPLLGSTAEDELQLEEVNSTICTEEIVRSLLKNKELPSAADLTKIAAAKIHANKRLKELGFRLLVPIHDEFLAECPIENAKECKELFAKCMCDAAVDLGIPISCDVACSYEWYGEEIEV